MESDASFSRTALTAAAARAAHLIVDDDPRIFSDTLAAALLGDRADELLDYHRKFGAHPILAGARTEAVCRSRCTEDLLAASGLTQYVILGAGLDTYAYRTGAPGTVVEVDHPASQQWKRRALADAGIDAPGSVSFVPVDLETDSHVEALVAAGVDLGRPTFVSWLGVTMYLTEEALATTLRAVATFPPGTQLVADYLLPAELRDDAGRAYADGVGPVLAQDGEPWRSFYAPERLTELLIRSGFTTVTHHDQAHTVPPSVWSRTDALRPMALSGLVHATV